MKTKISETRLKDALETVTNKLESQLEKESKEASVRVDEVERKLRSNIDNFQSEIEIELGGSNETKSGRTRRTCSRTSSSASRSSRWTSPFPPSTRRTPKPSTSCAKPPSSSTIYTATSRCSTRTSRKSKT